MPTPNPAGAAGGSQFHGVAAAASNNVWAVGQTLTFDNNTGYTWHPLVEHWNGTAWSSVKSPLGTEPWGVTSVSGSDAWLVGVTGSASSSYAATAEHWNGTSWATVPGPNPGPGDSEDDSTSSNGGPRQLR